MPDATPRRTSYYVEPAELAALLRAHRRRRGGPASEGLGAALLKIAGGVWDRYHFTADRDDFVQDVLVHLLDRPLKRADPKHNLHAYFTTCAIRFGIKLRHKANCERRRFETYAQECVDAGRQVPTHFDGGAPEDIKEGRFSRGVYERHRQRARAGR